MDRKDAVVLLEAHRQGYAIDQLYETMTVGDLIDYLEYEYEEDQPIYISNDQGYTYGSINSGDFRVAAFTEDGGEEVLESAKPKRRLRSKVVESLSSNSKPNRIRNRKRK